MIASESTKDGAGLATQQLAGETKQLSRTTASHTTQPRSKRPRCGKASTSKPSTSTNKAPPADAPYSVSPSFAISTAGPSSATVSPAPVDAGPSSTSVFRLKPSPAQLPYPTPVSTARRPPTQAGRSSHPSPSPTPPGPPVPLSSRTSGLECAQASPLPLHHASTGVTVPFHLPSTPLSPSRRRNNMQAQVSHHGVSLPPLSSLLHSIAHYESQSDQPLERDRYDPFYIPRPHFDPRFPH
ncbi:hypothetical protein K474DRAFT_1708504 [Panus rudis PR-1116 ss-1]|nr:hypothetical protein K474DRAFT_1708504 [Panus rudis PR-1116 ss-1]